MTMRALTLRLCVALLAQLPLALSPARAQAARASNDSMSQVDEAFRSWLIEHLDRRDQYFADDPSHESPDAKVQYAHATARLVDSLPPMDLVWLIGNNWCGSSGCTTVVIDRSSGTPRIVDEINLTRPPISVLPTTSNGWHDIRVLAWGGGQIVPDWATFRFDGKEYWDRRHTPKRGALPSGKVVFTDATPLHFLYRCRRKTVGEDLRDCKVPKLIPPKQ